MAIVAAQKEHNIGIPVDKEAIAAICRKNGIKELSLFGSVLRVDFIPGKSDIDVLVEFAPGEQPSFLDLAGILGELADLLGHKVDLVQKHTLRPYLSDEILSARRVIYDATQ